MIVEARHDSTGELVATIVALAALDLVGSLLAKEWILLLQAYLVLAPNESSAAELAPIARR